jgi:malonyl-CoA/methylmalonyl-CoA synthetase
LIDPAGDERALTGSDLLEETATAASALAGWGVRRGDRVLWSCHANLDSIVVLLGALRLGAVVVPVNPASTPSEMAHLLSDARPTAAILDRPEQMAESGCHQARPVELLTHGVGTGVPVLDAVTASDDALCVYTSGTTGRPKGAVHTHGSLVAGVESLRVAWDWQPEDRLILALPLFHVHGLCAGLFGTLSAGASALILERFSPEAVLDAAPGATMFFGVPTMYHRLAETGRMAALSALRLCVSGSAPLPSALWHRCHDDGVIVLERYGMSETLLTLSNPLRGERRPGTVGLPLPGVEAAIDDPDDDGVGELLVRGPSMCRGYWERPEATAASWRDGWFATGDLASLDGDGYVAIRGRQTELIITGGHNVYPAEVEAVLARHASVAEVAVVGIPSEEWGETVVAFVVGAGSPPDLGALEALASRELASYKCPRQLRVLPALPRNAMGKVLRSELRQA